MEPHAKIEIRPNFEGQEDVLYPLFMLVVFLVMFCCVFYSQF
jgi:hypothetical protein